MVARRGSVLISAAFCERQTRASGRGSEGTVETITAPPNGGFMLLDEMMDKLINGQMSTSDLEKVRKDINDGKNISKKTITAMLADLVVLRHNYTMTVMLRDAVNVLIRLKPSIRHEESDYKKAVNIIKFLQSEAEALGE
jgi:hypothetical protein